MFVRALATDLDMPGQVGQTLKIIWLDISRHQIFFTLHLKPENDVIFGQTVIVFLFRL